MPADTMNEHSMDVEGLIGRPMEVVPPVPPGWDCNARRWERNEEADDVRIFVGYCKNRAGKGTDHVGEGRCKFHGGAADNVGRENGNYRHGAYTADYPDDLSRNPADVVENLHEETSAGREEIARTLAAISVNQFRRSGDPRFLERYEAYLMLVWPDLRDCL